MIESISVKSVARIVFIAFFTISCESDVNLSSGIEGKVMRGPVNGGPEIIGQINDEPFSALFHVTKSSQSSVSFFNTDENGEFIILLPPGVYQITPDETAPLMMPELQSREVVVYVDSITSIVLDFDTGIR